MPRDAPVTMATLLVCSVMAGPFSECPAGDLRRAWADNGPSLLPDNYAVFGMIIRTIRTI
jgi:hypothetical protein